MLKPAGTADHEKLREILQCYVPHQPSALGKNGNGWRGSLLKQRHGVFKRRSGGHRGDVTHDGAIDWYRTSIRLKCFDKRRARGQIPPSVWHRQQQETPAGLSPVAVWRRHRARPVSAELRTE